MPRRDGKHGDRLPRAVALIVSAALTFAASAATQQQTPPPPPPPPTTPPVTTPTPPQATPPAPPPGTTFERVWEQLFDATGSLYLTIAGDLAVVSGTDTPVVARRAADGSDAWTAALVADAEPIAGDDVIVMLSGGRLHALEFTGQVRWSAAAGASFSGEAIGGIRLGTGAAPMLPLPTEARRTLSGAPGTALVASGRDLQAVRVADGAQLWRTTLPAPVLNKVVVDGGRAFAGLGDTTLVALDVTTGAVVWRRSLSAVPGPLAAAGGHVYFGGSDHACHAYRQSNGEQAWWYLKRTPIAGRPAADAERAYFVLLTNIVLALDRDTGNERWDERVSARLAHGLEAAGDALLLALGDGTALMLRTGDGHITTIRAAPKPGERGGGLQFEAMGASADGTRVYTLTEMALKYTLSAYVKK